MFAIGLIRYILASSRFVHGTVVYREKTPILKKKNEYNNKGEGRLISFRFRLTSSQVHILSLIRANLSVTLLVRI